MTREADAKRPMTLPRAYLRMSPNMDQHPDPLGMVLLLCAACRQPQRGRFRDRAVLTRTLGPGRLKRFLERHDLVPIPGGWYVEGWDEWQEGDLTVGDRQRRIRERKRDDGVTGALSHRDAPVTPSRPGNGEVTLSALPERNSPSEAVDVRRSSPHGEQDERIDEASDSRGARAGGPVDPPHEGEREPEEAVPWA